MSDVALASRYAADNYPKALDNLSKVFEKEDQPVHYSGAAFDGLSEDQAKATLRFFGKIGLIDIPKQGTYSPPEELVTWRVSMEGPAKEEAESEVRNLIMGYGVFEEATFLLSAEGKKIDQLAKDIGGRLGLNKDDLPDLEKTIEVLIECGFLDMGENRVVTIPDANPVANQSTGVDETPVENAPPVIQDGNPDERVDSAANTGVRASVSISFDATEMDSDDLRKKLEVIKETVQYDAE